MLQQARDVRNNEVVAIKKMSYSGKQTNEVRWAKKVAVFNVITSWSECFWVCAEMAGYYQRGEVPAETPASKHNWVSGMLPQGAHGLGVYHYRLQSTETFVLQKVSSGSFSDP